MSCITAPGMVARSCHGWASGPNRGVGFGPLEVAPLRAPSARPVPRTGARCEMCRICPSDRGDAAVAPGEARAAARNTPAPKAAHLAGCLTSARSSGCEDGDSFLLALSGAYARATVPATSFPRGGEERDIDELPRPC